MPTALPRPLAITLLLVTALTAVRIIVLHVTAVELYPDEAQYWLWSREIAGGYYSKPPMVAWLIAASTAVGGDGEAWVRLPAALCHGAAALAVYAAGRRLYGAWVGALAAALYSLMPGVQLSAGLMTTDAPLLMFLSFGLWAYAVLLRGERRERPWAAAGLGLALGLAFLSKYAALYFIGGLALHAVIAGEARRTWSPAALLAAVAAAAAAMAPNVAWNAAHRFSTVAHTAENANWSGGGLFNAEALASFVSAQFGVFGPIPFAVLAGGAVLLAVRRRLTSEDMALLCLALPPLLVVATQAFISRANANWAAAAYVPGAVLAAAWLLRWRARGWIAAAIGLQGLLAAVFLVAVASPAAAERLGLSNAFKRAKGWAALTRQVEAAVANGRWSAVAVDDRFLFNAMAYYGRDWLGRPGAPPLRMWVREAQAQNQAEAEAPLRPSEADAALVASLTPDYRGEIAADFQGWRPLGEIRVQLDRKRTREAALFAASGYVRAPRDPATGLPLSARPTAP